jgi:hypothetical protein
MYTADVVLPSEDADQYRALKSAWHKQYQPENPTEGHLVETIVATIWHRRRLQAIEVGTLDLPKCERAGNLHKAFTTLTANVEMANAVRADFNNARALTDVWRNEVRLDRSIARSLKEFQRLVDLRPHEPDTKPDPNADKTGPETDEQKSQNQSQEPATEVEPKRSGDQPAPHCVLKDSSRAPEPPEIEWAPPESESSRNLKAT